MPIIGMIGPHAVGKSQALKRWKGRYGDRLQTFSLDDLRKTYPDNAAKALLLEECRASPVVSVIESARGFASWVYALLPTEPILVLTTPEPIAREWWGMRRRAKGKSPELGEYWSEKRLDYECNGHLTNCADKLDPDQVHRFVVTDRERDWLVIDREFGNLFRRLHNEINHRRQK